MTRPDYKIQGNVSSVGNQGNIANSAGYVAGNQIYIENFSNVVPPDVERDRLNWQDVSSTLAGTGRKKLRPLLSLR